MPFCTVCKQFADYEYDIALSNGNHLHSSCLTKLQLRKDEIEVTLRRHSTQLILSIFTQSEVADGDVKSEEDARSLSSELSKLIDSLTSIYDFFPSWPPDWHERKRYLIQQNGSICFSCDEESDVFLIHEIPLSEYGTNELDNLELICMPCYESMYGKSDVFGDFTLNPSQSEFSEQVAEIQSAMKNNYRIRFEYKKPKVKTWMTRVIVPERLLNIPNSRESGQTLCVEGFCELRQANRVFALERMQDLEVIDY